MIITLAQLSLDHIQPIKNATPTEVKRIKEIIASGKLADQTYFKLGRKEFFFSVDNKRIAVEIGSGGSVNLYGVPERCISKIYIDTKEGYTVLSQDEVNAIAQKEQQRQDETDTIIACDAQYEGQIITIDQKWDASQLTCDVMEGWVGESCQIDFSAPEDDVCVMEYDYYCPGAIELYSYINNCDVVDPYVEKVIIHWSEASDIENTEFTSVAAAMEEMRSWYGNHPENLPQKGQGYDKTEVTVIFSNGDKYQNMRIDICACDDDDNPFSSEDVFYSHYRAWLESLKNGAWAKDDTHRQENVKKWSVFLDYDWGTGLEPIFSNVVSIKRSQAIADHVKTRYEAWITALLEKGESHKILSFEDWKRSVNFA